MKHFFTFLFFLIFCQLSFSFSVSAENNNVTKFSFEKSEDGALRLNQSVKDPVEVTYNSEFSIVAFEKNQSGGEYSIRLYDVSGTEVARYEFTGNTESFMYTIPYFSIASDYKIFNARTGALLLSGSLKNFIQCNANRVCEFEKGETISTCLSDCGSGKTQYSPETQQKLKQSGGVIRDEKTGDILLNNLSQKVTESQKSSNVLMIVFGAIGLVILFTLIVFWWRRN